MRVEAINIIRLVLVAMLLGLVARRATAQKALRAKYQDWSEDNDRIRVRSWYAEAETNLGEKGGLDVVGLVDHITGATPIGRPPGEYVFSPFIC